jgi:hypothetical protein
VFDCNNPATKKFHAACELCDDVGKHDLISELRFLVHCVAGHSWNATQDVHRHLDTRFYRTALNFGPPSPLRWYERWLLPEEMVGFRPTAEWKRQLKEVVTALKALHGRDEYNIVLRDMDRIFLDVLARESKRRRLRFEERRAAFKKFLAEEYRVLAQMVSLRFECRFFRASLLNTTENLILVCRFDCRTTGFARYARNPIRQTISFDASCVV